MKSLMKKFLKIVFQNFDELLRNSSESFRDLPQISNNTSLLIIISLMTFQTIFSLLSWISCLTSRNGCKGTVFNSTEDNSHQQKMRRRKGYLAKFNFIRDSN